MSAVVLSSAGDEQRVGTLITSRHFPRKKYIPFVDVRQGFFAIGLGPLVPGLWIAQDVSNKRAKSCVSITFHERQLHWLYHFALNIRQGRLADFRFFAGQVG